MLGVAVRLSKSGIVLLLALACVAGASAQSAPTGIDVSHYQGRIDWLGVAGAGVDFAFVKATEGTTLTDLTYPLNRQAANSVGVKIGAYHFARPAGASEAAIAASAIAQADAFLAFAQPAAGDLLPALDLEKTGNLSVTDLTAWTQTWLEEVDARIGVRPIVYASPNFWKRYLGDTPIFALAGDALWIAHWTSSALPILPGGGWGGVGWTFWQWSDCQHVTGIAHCVDGDRFNGAALDAETIRPFPSGVPVSSEAPAIQGTPQAGKLLAALPGGWDGGKPVSFTYQWQTCSAAGAGCVPIPGATDEAYTPTAADVGHALVATVTAQAGGGTATATSAPTLAVASSATPSPSTAPSPITPPTIAGTAQVGQVLTGQVGTWKGAPTSFSYQWRRCDSTGAACAAITGAGATTYTLTPGDIGAVLSLVVTATGRGGSRSATSAGSPPITSVPVPPAVVGSIVAEPGQAGAVTITGGGATATWQPGTVTQSSMITLASGPSKLALSSSAVSLGIAGPAPLPFPIDVQYAAAAPDAVPGFIAVAGVWQPIAQLVGPSLPDGQNTGAYRDAAGALHVLTRLPGRIALFAPGKWGDPRFVSSRRPSLTVVNDVTVARHADGSALIRARITLDTQAHLYVGVLTPQGQALVPQHGNRVGWWLQGQPTKTIQTLQLRPGAFPIRLLVPAGQLKATGRYALRLAALDPYGRRVQLVIGIPQLGATG